MPTVGKIHCDRFGRSPTVVREAISASSPAALRSAHTAVRRLAQGRVPGAARPQLRRYDLSVVRSRAQRKKGKQRADRRWERELLAVAFRGHFSQQPHLEHLLTVYPELGSRLLGPS